jgi:DNA-binding response OmpR family regulator
MSKREILIADSDGTVRNKLADSFRSAGFDVETTDSTTHLFCSVLEKQIPVVLLGSGCDKKIAMANLVPLLKKCNKGVTIILVSDEESLPTIRSVRQEGIFYHALKPTGLDDTEELLTAVKCAFDKSETTQPSRPVAKPELSPSAEIPSAAPVMMEQSSEEPELTVQGIIPPSVAPAMMMEQASEEQPEPVTAETTRESWHGEKKLGPTSAAILSALTVAGAGFVYCVIAAIKGMIESGDFAITAFLGFCALIAVGQLLPAFLRVREARKVVAQRLRENVAVDGDKQQAYVACDKNK